MSNSLVHPTYHTGELEEFFRLAERSSGSQYFKKGEALYKKGEKAEGVFIIKSGKVKVVSQNKQGPKCIIGFYKAGELVGLHHIFHDEEFYPSSVIAMEQTSAAFFTKEKFFRALKKNKSLYLNVMNNLCHDLELIESRMNGFAGKNADQRLADECLYLNHFFNGNNMLPQNIPIDLSDIAALIKVSDNTAQKLLKDFSAKKIISYRDGILQILNKEQLYHIANFAS